MHIAIVLNASWNVYNFRLGLLRALEKAGHRISVIAPRDAYSLRLGFPHYDIELQSRGRNPLRDLGFFLNLCRLYRRLKPDIVLHFTPKPNIYGAMAAAVLGIPSINNIAGLGSTFSNIGWTTRMIRILYRLAMRFPRKVFFQNPEDLEIFVREGLVMREKVDRLPGSGVDTERFRPRPVSRRDTTVVFLLASRMLKEKGIEEFVGAARLLRSQGFHAEFQLLGFLGEGEGAITRAQMSEWERDGSVQYLGETDKVEEFMSCADCIVLPSYYREGVPRVLLEAAGLGKPIIASNNVGCREVVVNGLNGFLCKPRDVFDLAEKMKAFLALDSKSREAMGIKGREKAVSEFDERIVIDKYLSTINDLSKTS